MKNAFLIFLSTLLWITGTQAFADEYKIAGVGQPVIKAIAALEEKLETANTRITLDQVSGVAANKELLGFLQQDRINIAVVPFQHIPNLRGSPLLEPFLAKDALKLRQTINSETGALQKNRIVEDGFRVLDIWHVSSSIFASAKPVLTPKDLAGLKVRNSSRLLGQTLEALGASPVNMAAAEVFTALQTGVIDSSAVPFDERATALGIHEIAGQYVDRLFQPQLYAVVVTIPKWKAMPFQDQHHLAKAVVEIGESLVGPLQAQAERFRSEQLARGAKFNSWNVESVNQVRLASLDANRSFLGTPVETRQAAINLAYANAAAVAQPEPVNVEPQPAQTIDLLFATDRKKVDLTNPETAFSSVRKISGMNFGTAKIKLSDKRKFGDDLEDVVTINNLSSMNAQDSWTKIKDPQKPDIVVFIHGYNNSFTDSIRRGATIQADIAPGSTVISYTWPSDGELLSYGYDESSTDTALQNFTRFMDKLTDTVPAAQVNVIAHSMGSRLLTKYLGRMAERGLKPKTHTFKNIVFAAADISTTFFQQKEEDPFIAGFPLSAYGKQITLYSSKHDRPLKVSNTLHNDLRLGLADANSLYLDADLISVDASQIDPAKFYQNFTFATRHSYVFDKQAGVRELSALLAGTDPVNRAGMNEQDRDGLKFWTLMP